MAALALAQHASRILLAIREDWWSQLEDFRRRIAATPIEAIRIPAAYPLDHNAIVCDLINAGVLQPVATSQISVVDSQTLIDIAALSTKQPTAWRTIAVVGEVDRPALISLPIGTPIGEIVAFVGGAPLGHAVRQNDPLHGNLVNENDAVDLDTRVLYVLSHRHPLLVRATVPAHNQLARATSACVSCRVCTDTCPDFINGGTLQPHLLMNGQADSTSAMVLGCSGCGVCDVTCPAGLAPRSVAHQLAEELRRRSFRLATPADQQLTPIVERPLRRLPIETLTARLGLTAQQPAQLPHRTLIPKRLRLPLVLKAGAKRWATVAVGQRFDTAARIARGEQTPDIFAPGPGIVCAADDQTLLVELR